MPDVGILLVDDQPANLLALEAVLHPLGHTLVSADSGASALKQLLLRDFAVILLDARMPGLDGYETAALIRRRERSAHTPIIFLTADVGVHDDILCAYQHGAVDFMSKPFEPRILRAKIAVFVQLHRQREQIERQAESLREQERAAVEAEASRRAAEWLRDQEKAHVERLQEERRAAEQHAAELAQVSAELVRSNRELEQVAYGAAHDLKAPLRGIATVCDWLEDDLADAMNDDARKHLGQLRGRVGRMGAVVDGILAFAQVGQSRSQLELVEGQGGRAWVESQPGHGATFRFLWPIAPPPPAAAAAP